MKPISVTQFIDLVNDALAAMETVVVEGEVVDYKVIQNKWVVFDLKDDTSLVKCFMTIWNLKTVIEDGMLVRASGQPKLRNKGFFSFVVDSVQPAGEGSLKRAFELLKRKLEAEGVFSPERKRLLPRFPERIALITSRDAAAFGDFRKVLAARQGGLTINLFHTAVQGEEAPENLIQALEQVNTSPELFDVIVMIRGGGSMEDLQAFNDEGVIRAVARSRIPTIVGIGHERDVTLAELAADVRASTPSNAAELLVRSREEVMLEINRLQQRLQQAVHMKLDTELEAVNHAVNVLKNKITATRQKVTHTISSLFAQQPRFKQTLLHHRQHIGILQQNLLRQTRITLTHAVQKLQHSTRLLTSFSPHAILKRGYSITRLKNGQILKSTKQTKPGQAIITQLSDGSVSSRVQADDTSQLELKL